MHTGNHHEMFWVKGHKRQLPVLGCILTLNNFILPKKQTSESHGETTGKEKTHLEERG